MTTISSGEIDERALAQMRENSKGREEVRWAAYRNKDLGSAAVGELRFLLVGKDCTYTEAPPRYPDTDFGLGWRYLMIGYVDLETGDIVK